MGSCAAPSIKDDKFITADYFNSALKVYRTVADNLINVVTALYATVDPIDIVRFQTSPHRLVFLAGRFGVLNGRV